MILNVGACFGTVISTPEDALLFKHAKRALFRTESGPSDEKDYVDFTDDEIAKLMYPIRVSGGAITASDHTLWYLEERSDKIIADLKGVLDRSYEIIKNLQQQVCDIRKFFGSVWTIERDRKPTLLEEILIAQYDDSVRESLRRKNKK